jgi:hypothetical protein
VFKRPSSTGPSGPFFYTSVAAALIGFGLFFDHVAFDAPPDEPAATVGSALAREHASTAVQQVVRWAIEAQDHAGLPFVVIDKARAMLFAFDPSGRLIGGAPVLLGASRTDGPAAEGATPAGRFVAATWLSMKGDRLVWINADAAVTLHGVPSNASPGRAARRLASAEVEDKRISDGSLHVSGEFYREHLLALKGQVSIAYVLPEVVPVRDVFEMGPETLLNLAHSPRTAAAARNPS